MSKELIDRIRKARQCTLSVLGRTFTVRRPTDLEMQEMAGKIDQRLLLTKFIVDWGVMSEIDLGVPGGGPDPVPFSPELWAEWIADHPAYWDDLSKAVVDTYRTHYDQMEASAKN